MLSLALVITMYSNNQEGINRPKTQKIRQTTLSTSHPNVAVTPNSLKMNNQPAKTDTHATSEMQMTDNQTPRIWRNSGKKSEKNPPLENENFSGRKLVVTTVED